MVEKIAISGKVSCYVYHKIKSMFLGKKKDFFFDQVDRKIVVEINFRKHLFLFSAFEIIYATLSYDLFYLFFIYYVSTR